MIHVNTKQQKVFKIMKEKTCFVIMGFGKKMDYQTGKLVDLDVVYRDMIKPLFNESSEYKVIRGDEILTSKLIDTEMYRLLLDADLVIADITTYNPNALYELGVRHALRPASTIIIAQESVNLAAYPFDLNHCRIFSYKNFESDSDAEKNEHIEKMQNKLKRVISNCRAGETDSPVYTYLENLYPPEQREMQVLGGERMMIRKTQITELTRVVEQITKANTAMRESDFKQAIPLWASLHQELSHYPYVIQQYSLAIYKYEQPTKKDALEQSWTIINELPVDTTVDTETLGIAGAICKRLYLETQNDEWLEKAIRYYNKGFVTSQDYYTGENYANCLMIKMQQDDLSQADRYGIDYLRKNTCKQIVEILKETEKEHGLDKWQLATMSNCYFHLQDKNSAKQYEEQFLKKDPANWEIETFNKTKEDIKKVLNA